LIHGWHGIPNRKARKQFIFRAFISFALVAARKTLSTASACKTPQQMRTRSITLYFYDPIRQVNTEVNDYRLKVDSFERRMKFD